jgi:uncharacterized protein (DUF1501 family)
MDESIAVVVFLRGGADGLSIVSPAGDRNYVAARPAPLRVQRAGESPGHPLRHALADVDFRFHGRAKGLTELFEAGELAVIHATGLRDATRSHFDAEDRMERGAPRAGTLASGWLGRWLASAKPQGILPALAVGSALPDSLRGSAGVAVAEDLNSLRAAPGYGLAEAIRSLLSQRFADDPLLGGPVKHLLTLTRAIEARIAVDKDGNLKPYQPLHDYPADNPLANSLRTVAQAIKLDLGLRVATVDFGGWDTHVDQVWQLNALIDQLSAGLMAFWKDLGPYQERVNIVVMSEFGRRLKSNESGGTDHGHGNLMMVIGSGVRGGRMYGTWPGLENEALDEGADLAITTDYRHVLTDVMSGHMGFADTGTLFPDFEATPIGFMRA